MFVAERIVLVVLVMPREVVESRWCRVVDEVSLYQWLIIIDRCHWCSAANISKEICLFHCRNVLRHILLFGRCWHKNDLHLFLLLFFDDFFLFLLLGWQELWCLIERRSEVGWKSSQ